MLSGFLTKIIQKPLFIVIEGNSGIGKSTTSAILSQMLNTEWFGEYTDFINLSAGEAIPQFPPLSEEEVLMTNPIWPRIDLRREFCRLKKSHISSNIQIIDTSPISVLGFEFAKAVQGLPHGIQDLAIRYQKLYMGKHLVEPNGWIFLDASTETNINRIIDRGGTHEFLFRKSTIELMRKFRRLFAHTYLDHSHYIFICNDSLSPEETCLIALDFLKNLPVKPSTGMIKFFTELSIESRKVNQIIELIQI